MTLTANTVRACSGKASSMARRMSILVTSRGQAKVYRFNEPMML